MNALEYGLVLIKEGHLKGRIGNYDDDEFITGDSLQWSEDLDDFSDREEVAIVYFGLAFECQEYYLIPYRQLSPATTDDLSKRRLEIRSKLISWGLQNRDLPDTYEFMELLLIENELIERIMSARYRKTEKGKRLFISYSSKDKNFARKLCADLTCFGHSPWLDEWNIRVGDSIPERIDVGLEEADFIIVVLSKNSVESNWVKREWQAKYWDEIELGEIKVLPALIQDCAIPQLLKMKKYANFVNDYNLGLDDILNTLLR